MSDRCVCSASHGQPPGPRRRRASATSAPNASARPGGQVDEHRREVVGVDDAVEVDERHRRPRARRAGRAAGAPTTGVSGPVRSRRASFTSDATRGPSTCAMSTGPPASRSAGSSARPSTTRAPPSGSTPTWAHASSANDTPGTTVEAELAGRGALVQQSHAALGDDRVPRHRVQDLVVLGGRGDQRVDDARVHVVDRGGVVVHVVERREGHALGREVVDRRGGAPCARSAPGPASISARARGHEEIDPGRPEPHDHDARHRGPGASPARA